MRAPVAQLTVHDLTHRYESGTRPVLDRISLTVKPGEKVGIIGDNGSGKSTLLKLLAGVLVPTAGEVTVAAPGGVGYLAQSLDLPAQARVRDAIDLALADIRSLERELRRAETALEGLRGADLDRALESYAELLARFEARDGYQADARVEVALHGLGLPGLARERRLGTLSGGERSRLALAATLAAAPELLLLDEPTNDLDDRALTWLEDHLRRWRGTVVAVTHDRVFLEHLTSTILEVDEAKATRYGDGYRGYVAAKAAERRRRIQEYDQWQTELARNRRLAGSNVARLDAIPRKVPLAVFGHGGFRARGRGHGAMVRIRNAKERVARLTANPAQLPPDPLEFSAKLARAGEEEGQGGQGYAVEVSGLHVPGRLDLPHLRLAAGGRLLVTGPNGAGKSTLLAVLAGELAPAAGTVRVPGRVGHLRQRETPWPAAMPLLRAFAHGRPGTVDEHREQLLSLGLFRPADLRLRVGELSYGQRRRIELARLVTEEVDLLLLDEPTNHLSPALVEDLEEALASYTGALVVVTHDRRMRERFEGTRLELARGCPLAVGA
ncbi:TlrC/CarA/OleB/SrmB family ABC-F type ribosomal protection protein [Streptomyces indicus]|uniref:Macrolide transport system ATP-binding/permease protein n=1 Tax=Streptomyces indicus TaxID=417292 RepID=A0A1G9HLQ8_9ACTN|nr:TlrC/CarA/OleB/SrmB family ABC-F type ribosomal protection protein [Streptomyces indicus]SDL13918.1 macrolide transport system ATP-binding/permease protein [Streptomyces indicus]